MEFLLFVIHIDIVNFKILTIVNHYKLPTFLFINFEPSSVYWLLLYMDLACLYLLKFIVNPMIQTECIYDQIRPIIFQKSKSNNLMSKQPEGEQMFEIGQQKPGQIGTEIFDPTMPSDLDFDNKKQQEYQGKQINESNGLKQEKGKTKLAFDEDIKSYKIKGKIDFTAQPKYKCASYLKGHVDTFQVKAYDEQKSGGMKSIWESLVGYVKREICIQGGYIYIFEKTKQGYLTHAALKLVDLFKIFVDHEQSKIRFVFHIDKEHLTNKNFQVKSCQDLIQKIMEQSSKIGLMTISQ